MDRETAEALEIPDPNPTYTNICWNCKEPIDNVTCMHGGFDKNGCPNGFICNKCGLHLGDRLNKK